VVEADRTQITLVGHHATPGYEVQTKAWNIVVMSCTRATVFSENSVVAMVSGTGHQYLRRLCTHMTAEGEARTPPPLSGGIHHPRRPPCPMVA
jgi:hypothetical protein